MDDVARMNHKQRVRAALAGEPVDYPPVALWAHDFEREWDAAELAAATLDAYRAYDWDLIKLNPRATYYWEAWGNTYEPTGTTQPRMVSHALDDHAALRDLPVLDPATTPQFAEQLEALTRVVREAGGDVDIIQTVFNPLTVAGGLLGMRPPAFVALAKDHPASVHAGLAAIARTLAAYARACVDAGASGIFFATVDWATLDAADASFYREFGRPYDLQVLASVANAPLNVLHVCRDRNLLELLLDYPVAAFNWDVHGPDNPPLHVIAGRTHAALMGGVDRKVLRDGTPADVQTQVQEALLSTGQRHLILAGGCSIAPEAPAANLRAFVDAAHAG